MRKKKDCNRKDLQEKAGRKPKVILEFLRMEEGKLVAEGIYEAWPGQEPSVRLSVEINGRKVPMEFIRRNFQHRPVYEETIVWKEGFFCRIPLPKRKNAIITFSYREKAGGKLSEAALESGVHCCIGTECPGSYAVLGKWMVCYHGAGILIQRNCMVKQIGKELSFCLRLVGSRDKSMMKAAVVRMLYHGKHLLKRKKIWLISDKPFRADDNGEALFLYLNKHQDSGREVHFLLDSQTADAKRLSKEGSVVPFLSWKHKLLFLLCDYNVTAYGQYGIVSPFGKYFAPYRDLAARHKTIFIQHGIVHNDLSGILNRYNKGFSMMTASTKREQEGFLTYPYFYGPKEIALTGLARYDRLYEDSRRIITFAPTWRKELNVSVDIHEIPTLVEDFEESSYYQNVVKLLNDERLLNLAKELGYTIQFVPHTMLLPHIQRFKLDPRVRVLGDAVVYREVFAQSDLLITDYSSVAFDFAYLGKPVLYFQFDQETFLDGSHYGHGYYDYDRDGFGEVTETLEETLQLVMDYMKENCQVKEKYRKRMETFFTFRDQENCRRIVEAIQQL